MADQGGRTETLQPLLDRLAGGDTAAADDLIAHAMERLRRLARKMLRDNPRVRRWEQTDDVLHNALVRLHRALKAVRPESVRAFMGLAAKQIRRELIDLGRHHYGPEGHAEHHASDPQGRDEQGDARPRVEAHAESASGPLSQLQWQEFHELVQALPDEEREVFDLTFYQDMPQAEVARLLNVSVPTVKRRWRSAKLLLHQAMKTTPPEV
jgi:RNA polymerase sigma-70 factor (ECF subfamily)